MRVFDISSAPQDETFIFFIIQPMLRGQHSKEAGIVMQLIRFHLDNAPFSVDRDNKVGITKGRQIKAFAMTHNVRNMSDIQLVEI